MPDPPEPSEALIEPSPLDLDGHQLAGIRDRIARRLAGRGVSFGAAPFVVDPVPRAIGAAEWDALEAGVAQRVRALNAFVADVYGPRRIVRAGVVPERVITSAVHHVPEQDERSLGPAPVTIAGLDVVRGADGRFLVLEDNTRTPSGLAYALAAREALDAEIEVPEGRRALDGVLAALGRALRAVAPGGRPDPVVVLLSDGPGNSAWYEHRTLAAALGIPLVALGDLEARPDGVVARIDGAEERVDVVYRRTDEDRVLDGRGRVTPVARRLLGACRRGQLRCVNAFGTGIADDKLTHAYVEDMVRFYLGEAPLLPSVHSYDLAVPATREDVLARIAEVVVKPRAASGGDGVFIGAHARPEDRLAMAARVRASPEDYIAQDTVSLSRHPTVVGNRLEPRHVDLRAMAFAVGDEVTVVPGGLTRVALAAGDLVVNSSRDGGGKDTWVLA